MSNSETIQYNRAKSWQIITYPLNNGVNNIFLVLMMFASYLAAGSYGIAVAVAGTIITFTRVFDGFTDPLIGLFSEKLNTKFGKVRILLFIGWTIMAVSVLSLFFWGIGQGIVFFTVMYMVYIIGYTIFGVAAQPGNAIITNDPVQRPKLYRWSTIYTLFLSTFISVYMSKVLFPKYRGLSIGAFQEMCLTVVIVSFVLLVISCIGISEKDKPEAFTNVKHESIKLRDAFKLLKSNKALQMFIIAASSDKLALQAARQQVILTMVFGILIGNYEFSGTLGLINFIPTILIIFAATRFAGKKGSKKGLVQWTWISISVSVAMVLFMMISDPTKISVAAIPTGIFILLNMATAASVMATSACTGAMIPDIVDYEKYRSGKFMPAVVGTVYSFVDKMISSLATTIVGFAVAAIGYTTAMPQPGDPSTTPVFWMTMFLWMGLPVIGWTMTLIAMKFYPLDKEMMEEVQRVNAQGKISDLEEDGISA